MNFTDETNIFTTLQNNVTPSASRSSIKPMETDDEDTGWSSGRKSLEDQVSIRVIYGCIAVLGIVGNFLVMFTVARVPNLRTLTNVFIVSLAFCDFITSVFLIPLHLGKIETFLLFVIGCTTVKINVSKSRLEGLKKNIKCVSAIYVLFRINIRYKTKQKTTTDRAKLRSIFH